jgi:hypothetical protein
VHQETQLCTSKVLKIKESTKSLNIFSKWKKFQMLTQGKVPFKKICQMIAQLDLSMRKGQSNSFQQQMIAKQFWSSK